MDWLRNLSALILKISEEWGDVPGAALPAINLLLDIGKWGEKKGVKPKIIKELCEKHDKMHLNIGNFEELRAAGISEREIETAFSHEIAKLDNPSLVRYLESSNRYKNESITQLFSLFENFQMAIRSQYVIMRPSQIVLQNPPINKEYAKPVFFRKTGPTFADIEEKRVYVREEINLITDSLEKNGAVLLVGDAATGKTVITRTIAHAAMKKGWKVFFVEIKTNSIDFGLLSEDIAKINNVESETLLIIEDVHLEPMHMNSFLSSRHSGWPKLLITTRTTEPQLHGESINNFKILPQIKLENYSPTQKIIELYFDSKKKDHWKLSKQLKADILEYSQNNLWVLAYALRSLSETNGKSIQKESVLKQVERDLQSVSLLPLTMPDLQKKLFTPILLSLSVLSRYEIPTDPRFLANWIDDTTEREIDYVLSVLKEICEVTISYKNGFPLYSLPHSVLATLYYEYGENSKYYRLVKDENFFCEYATFDDSINSLQMFRRNLLSIVPEIQTEMFALELIRHSNIMRLGKKISQITELSVVVDCIRKIFEVNKTAGKNLLASIDYVQLGLIISQSKKLWDAGLCIRTVFENSETEGRQLFSHIDINRLCNSIANSKNIDDVGGCIFHIFIADETVGRQVWENIDVVMLGKNISQSTDLSAIGQCINNIYKANENAGKLLWENIDINMLGQTVSHSTNFFDAAQCIYMVFQTDKDKGEQILEQVDIKRLSNNISNSAEILDVGNCIERIHSASETASQNLLDNIDIVKFSQTISQCRNLYDVWFFIKQLYEINENACKQLLDLIDITNLAETISQNWDLRGLGRCVNIIFKANKQIGKKLWDNIDVTYLAETISLSMELNRIGGVTLFSTTPMEKAGECISNILKADKFAGEQLWEKIDSVNLVDTICQSNNYFWNCIFISDIFKANDRIGKKLWAGIDIDRLGKLISQDTELKDVGICINRIYDASETAGNQLLSRFDIVYLASTISKSTNLQKVAYCMESICQNNQSAIMELLSHLKNLRCEFSWNIENNQINLCSQ